MYKIDILFLDKEFEHDIYELIRAFYPGSEITSSYDERKEGCDLYFRIEKQDESCMIRYEDHENKGVTSAEFVEGQSSDALVSCSASEDADAKEQAHAIRKERKDIVTGTVQVIGQPDGQNPSMGKPDRDPSGEAGNGTY